MIKEINKDEVNILKPLMEYLASHHNEVSINFSGTYPRHNDEDRIKRFSNEIESGKSKAFVYFENNLAVGVIKIDLDNDEGVIDYFVVLDNFQGKGYGKALMEKALQSFKEHNIKKIELHVVYGNEAVHFYEKFGFKIQSYIMELKNN